MSAASRLLRLTLFTKDNCGLCTNAKQALTRVQTKVPSHPRVWSNLMVDRTISEDKHVAKKKN